MNLQRTFGANVRHYRRSKGLTLEQLADAVGVSRETIGKIERGNSAPLFDTVEKIAAALDISPLTLFSRELVPTGERGALLANIGTSLANMNNEQLSRVDKILIAFLGK